MVFRCQMFYGVVINEYKKNYVTEASWIVISYI